MSDAGNTVVIDGNRRLLAINMARNPQLTKDLGSNLRAGMAHRASHRSRRANNLHQAVPAPGTGPATTGNGASCQAST